MQVGQNRIQAMSLIHRQLYQSNNIKKISFKKYVETLIRLYKNSKCRSYKTYKISFTIVRFYLSN